MNEHVSDSFESVSLHKRIATDLGQQVSSGKLKPGEKLPSERQIARQFKASRATVRTALQHLEQEGLISRRERRSAVVAFRRNLAPHLRIACSHARLIRLLGRLGEAQSLPPRCQLQLLDLHQIHDIQHQLSHPATGADVLICDLEYIRCFDGHEQYSSPLPERLMTEAQIAEPLRSMCRAEDGKYFAIPLCYSPMVLYFNRDSFRQAGLEMPGGDFSCDQMLEMAHRLKGDGKYALQFRPTFAHLAALLACRGLSLYQTDGKTTLSAADDSINALQFIHDLLHVHKITPLLPRSDQINLFAERRCAMALDGFELFPCYQSRLGDDLGIRTLPNNSSCAGEGFALLAMKGQENVQAIEDLARGLLSPTTQKHFLDFQAGLPVRGELLHAHILAEHQVPPQAADVFLHQLQNCQKQNLPHSLDHKQAVENLFLKLWLGLDSVHDIAQQFRNL